MITIFFSNNIIILESIELAPGFAELGAEAFRHCGALEQIVLPEGLKKIGKFAFEHCESLGSFKAPDSLTDVAEGAFKHCAGLASLDLNSIEHIDKEAFKECRSLITVRIPRSLGYLASSAFEGCHNLFAFETEGEDAQFTAYGGALFENGGRKLRAYPPRRPDQTYQPPAAVTEIGEGAFRGALALEKIDLSGNEALTLDKDAFCDCRLLTEAVLPETVTVLPEGAFKNCVSLRSVSGTGGLKEIAAEAFMGCSALRALDIPDGAAVDPTAFTGAPDPRTLRGSE